MRETLPRVLSAYPNARVEAEMQQGRRAGGLMLYPSPPPVPKTSVQGLRIIKSARA
ncbi:hypothetical protein [Teichococcus vastitatis]|uniref:Uncharacterized protein n=1 Tax=Teichococcus vastitatis TaxID=2307076 RepID=A0ABS9W7Q3_9PROT|nr:hypothetical protein [Pseudoroseomonas vastitatis]MCI0754945.1 hypothetical protein [Pseudoroseomonas vastitatis]